MPILKILNSAFIFLHSKKGFTLVEIIVAISIIGLVAALITPNLRTFNQNQQLETAAADLVQALKQTQSSAMSRIACPSSFPTSEWRIKITPTGYQQTAVCTDLTGATSPTPQPFPFQNFTPSTITMSDNTCISNMMGNTIELVYKGNNIAFNCINGATSQSILGGVDINLRDSNNTNANWLIRLNRSGIIIKDTQI